MENPRTAAPIAAIDIHQGDQVVLDDRTKGTVARIVAEAGTGA